MLTVICVSLRSQAGLKTRLYVTENPSLRILPGRFHRSRYVRWRDKPRPGLLSRCGAPRRHAVGGGNDVFERHLLFEVDDARYRAGAVQIVEGVDGEPDVGAEQP